MKNFLASSPLRLYGTRSIVNVLCPIGAFKNTIDEAMANKKLPFFKKTDGEICMNNKSSCYIEIQGQLHITGEIELLVFVSIYKTSMFCRKKSCVFRRLAWSWIRSKTDSSGSCVLESTNEKQTNFFFQWSHGKRISWLSKSEENGIEEIRQSDENICLNVSSYNKRFQVPATLAPKKSFFVPANCQYNFLWFFDWASTTFVLKGNVS